MLATSQSQPFICKHLKLLYKKVSIVVTSSIIVWYPVTTNFWTIIVQKLKKYVYRISDNDFRLYVLLLYLYICHCRYTGHKNHEYKIDNCLNVKDTHVLAGSEDGYVYVWDLVEVCETHTHTHLICLICSEWDMEGRD